MVEKYGDDLIISIDSAKAIFCFRNTGYNVLHQSWYDNRSQDPVEEKHRIIQLAADIIREDIRSEIHNVTTYPPCDDFLGNCKGMVPNTLNTLLEGELNIYFFSLSFSSYYNSLSI